MYDRILSESLIISMLISRVSAVACIAVLFTYSILVDKFTTYSSSPSVTKFLYLSGFSITSFTVNCLTHLWYYGNIDYSKADEQ